MTGSTTVLLLIRIGTTRKVIRNTRLSADSVRLQSFRSILMYLPAIGAVVKVFATPETKTWFQKRRKKLNGLR